MPGFYARWMNRWERKLASRDTNRLVRPFEWGAHWLARLHFPQFPIEVNGQAAHHLSRFAAEAVRDSDRFYSYESVRDYHLDQNRLTFSSPAHSGYLENDTVHT